MKVAILSDIHGNQYALRRVLEQIDDMGIDEILLLGDFVGYYYGHSEVFYLLDQYKTTSIRGNHEELFLQSLSSEDILNQLQLKYGSSFKLMSEGLSKKRVDFIRALPDKHSLAIERIRVLMCHGSPWDANEYIYPDCSHETLNEFDKLDVDFVFCGHTHYPMTYKGNKVCMINVGSVGQSRLTGGLASWGVLNTANKVYTQMSTTYDVKPLLDEVRSIDPQLPYLEKVLLRNNFDGQF